VNIDLDEIWPERFLIHNDKLKPLLRGEGVTVGMFFELVSWRREGWLARLRSRGFNVRTLQDRVAVLPAISPVPPLGDEGVRLLGSAKERIALFDGDQLRWKELPIIEHNGKAAVRVRDGAAVRRRKSRGQPEYHIATLVHGNQINLSPRNETNALLHTYAHLGQQGPVVVRLVEQEDVYLVPHEQAVLPPPHRELLDLLAYDKKARWAFSKPVIKLVEAVFDKLGIQLHPQA